MRPLVYHGGVASYAFFTAVGIWAFGEAVLQALTRSGEARDPSYVWMVVGSLLGVGLAFWAASVDARLPGPAWLPVAVGLALLAIGMALRAWSVRTLGRYFKVIVGVEDDQPLVDTGPYAALRHPAYTGMLICCLGVGIALDSWPSIASALLLPTIGVLRRIAHEEQVLRNQLGPQYESYSGRTKRLIPRIW